MSIEDEEEFLDMMERENRDAMRERARQNKQRARVAAAILNGLYSNPNVIVHSSSCGWKICNADEATLAAMAASQADALIEELKK